MGGARLFLLSILVTIAVAQNQLFVESLAENPEEFHEQVIVVWENLLGRETMLQLDAYIKNNILLFNSTSYMVPMSDGVELNTIVNFPLGHRGEALPVVLDRTPYSAAAYEYLVGALFHFKGYIAVVQDMRGRYKSQGEWSFWRKSASDGYDTIDWITEQPWSNGEVMAFGISADGIAATCQEGHRPPPPGLKAQSLWVATGDGYDSSYYNGAFREGLLGGWLEGLGEGWFVPTLTKHEAYGPWWYPIDLSFRWNNTNVPAVHFGGWYDIFSWGTVQSFLGYQYQGGEGAKGNQYLVMDPLGHCGGGEYRFPRARNTWMLQITYDMFEQAQSKTPYSPKSLSICFYVMGPDPQTMSDTDAGNFWVCMDEFLPVTENLFYLHPDGFLSSTPVDSSNPNDDPSMYVYDPTYPVPTLGGNNLVIPTCGPYDQTVLEGRADVITFTSAPLSEAVAITGNITVTLFVSSNATDTDFTAKLTDVYDDKSYNIIDNVIRMRWRESKKTVTLMEPGEIYKVSIPMGGTSYVFNAGHQIRIDISSSNYPRFSTNLNNGNTINEKGDPVIALNTVYHGADYPSMVSLPVVSLNALQQASSSPN